VEVFSYLILNIRPSFVNSFQVVISSKYIAAFVSVSQMILFNSQVVKECPIIIWQSNQ